MSTVIFQSHYLFLESIIFLDLQIPLNKAITQSLKNQELHLNAALLHERDIVPLQILLSVCQLDAIIIYSKSRVKQHKKDKQDVAQLQRCSQGLIYAININLSSFNLIHCEIKDTQLSIKDMQLLSQGLQKTTHLKELFILNCQLTSQHLAQISESLQNCESLIVLDLSQNQLDDGMLIGKIVSAHSSRRDQIKWSKEIRGDEEEGENQLALQGLCEITLHQNKIDTKAIKDICQFLLYDSWTKSVGLRGNQIDEEGTQILNELLDTNESLISLDLRDNPGFNLPISKEIFDKLVRNIRMFKESKMLEDEEDESQNNDGIDYNDPQYMENVPIQEVQEDDDQQFECSNCQRLQQENLKLQYENVNLQMQMKQLAQGETTLYSQQYKFNDNDDLVTKIEMMMMDLTKMMDILEQQKGESQEQEVQQQKQIKKKKKKNHLNYSR